MAFWNKKEGEESTEYREARSTATANPPNSLSKNQDPPSAIFPAAKAASTGSVEPADSKSSLCQVDDLISQRHEKVRSALGQGTVIQGKLSFDTPVRIDGKLSGEVYSSRTLIVGKSGQIDARVEVASLVVYGTVRGSVKASEKIEVFEGGSLEGEIKTPAIMIESGAILNGDCDMGGRSKTVEAATGTHASSNATNKDGGNKETGVASPVNEPAKGTQHSHTAVDRATEAAPTV